MPRTYVVMAPGTSMVEKENGSAAWVGIATPVETLARNAKTSVPQDRRIGSSPPSQHLLSDCYCNCGWAMADTQNRSRRECQTWREHTAGGRDRLPRTQRLRINVARNPRA